MSTTQQTSSRIKGISAQALTCMVLVALAPASACEREPGILVNIAALPDGVERIRVRTTLGETRGMDIFLDRNQDRFAVRVPVGSQGSVQLDADGLDSMGCKLAMGSLTEPVPDNLSRFVERALVLSPLSFHICPFAPAMNFQVSAGLKSVAVGDLNGDLKPDLVVASITAGQISVLLGNGMGGFAPPPPPVAANIPVGTKPVAVAVGDFNGDLKPDLVVANYDIATNAFVSVLLGDGRGGFSPAPASPFPAGNYPYSVVVQDFNGDLKLDLAVANYGSATVSLLLGDGMAGFGLADHFSVGSQPDDVVAGDWNGDMKPDLAVVNNLGDAISVLLGDGIGRFSIAQNFNVGQQPGAVAVGDFNTDLKLDLAVTSAGASPDVTVLLGNGVGGFGATSIPFTIPPRAVAVGDFNGDRKPDLAVACADDTLVHSEIRVLLGNGLGGFGLASISPVGKNPVSIVSGNFNGDLKPDLAIANFTSGDVSVLLNQFD